MRARETSLELLALCVLLVSVLLLGAASSQGADAPPNTQPLSGFEQGVLDALNDARMHPQRFAQHLVDMKSEFEGRLWKRPGKVIIVTQEGISALDEAIAHLRAANPLPSFELSMGLTAAARDHVRDQGKTGDTGHVSLDGSTPSDRINRYGTWRARMAENIQYGADTPKDVIISLIVDDGVADRGHRRNIFDPYLHVVGVACGPHPYYERMCVTPFAARYEEKADGVGLGQPTLGLDSSPGGIGYSAPETP